MSIGINGLYELFYIFYFGSFSVLTDKLLLSFEDYPKEDSDDEDDE